MKQQQNIPYRFEIYYTKIKKENDKKVLKKFGNNCKFKQNLAKIQDTNILRIISLSHEIIQYPFFKPGIVSLAHKDPHVQHTNFPKIQKKINFIQNFLKLES